uniref:Uncharacterized protein n=1 Tax=Anguilla anguilla TaxID=7936 RepID=A0A0E9Q0P3_ANGAN
MCVSFIIKFSHTYSHL